MDSLTYPADGIIYAAGMFAVFMLLYFIQPIAPIAAAVRTEVTIQLMIDLMRGEC